jgi:hypothetical protein
MVSPSGWPPPDDGPIYEPFGPPPGWSPGADAPVDPWPITPLVPPPATGLPARRPILVDARAGRPRRRLALGVGAIGAAFLLTLTAAIVSTWSRTPPATVLGTTSSGAGAEGQAPADLVTVVLGTLGGDLRPPGGDARLQVTDHAVRVERTGFTDVVAYAGATMTAPAGMRFVVSEVSVTWKAFAKFPASVTAEETWFSLEVGRTPRGEVELASPGSTGLRTIVATVPGDTSSVRLVARSPTLTQSIDVISGAHREEPPALFARERLSVDLTQRYELTTTATGAGRAPRYTISITATGASLVWDFYRHNPARTDRAYLVLDRYATFEPSLGLGSGPIIPAENMILRLPDGTQVVPGRRAYDGVYLFGGDLAWEVPADFERGTIVVTPGVVTARGYDGSPETYDFGPSTAEIEVAIPSR